MAENKEVWDEIYESGQHLNRYPWDCIVSFLFRESTGKVRQNMHVLEVGCGAGSNLWFAAREGFNVTGIEYSQAAADYAKHRLAQESLSGNILCGSFTHIELADNSVDLAFDRGALVCATPSDMEKALFEIRRVLKPGGRFLTTAYADTHTSCLTGRLNDQGQTVGIKAGTLQGVGGLTFSSIFDIRNRFAEGWKIISIEKVERNIIYQEDTAVSDTHCEYHVIAEVI